MAQFEPFSSGEKQLTETQQGLKPPWVEGGLATKKAIVKRFGETRAVLEEIDKERIQLMRNHLLWYKGRVDKAQEYRFTVPGKRDVPIPRRVLPVFIGQIVELTNQRVASLAKFKPATTVLPNNDEYRDKVRARLMDIMLSQVKRLNKFELMMHEVALWNTLFGEVYVCIDYDEHFGSYIDGKPTGDVKYKVVEPWKIFHEPKHRHEDVRHAYELHEILHIDEVRAKYKVRGLEPDKDTHVYTFDEGENYKNPDEVVVYKWYIKPNQFHEKGMVITLTNSKVLKIEEPYPYEHKCFPWERISDIDIPQELRGFSIYNHLVPIQHQYNKLSSLIHRNYTLFAHPKWMMPAGAAKIKSLGNASTVVEYKGQRPPELASFATTPAEVFTYRDQLREEMAQISGVHGVSRGEPPPGIRAGIALQFLEEQENLQRSTQILKHNDFIKRVMEKTASVIGQRYDTDDKRILKVLGKDNEYDIRALENADFSGPWDIEIQNTTALSESKAGKIAQIIELHNAFGPEVIAPEMVIDMLELAQNKKYFDITTRALRAAQSETQDILDGREVPPPAKHENHIQHWRSHYNDMQSRTFKEEVPEDRRQKLLDHLGVHEALMELQASRNPAFQQMLLTLEGYPAVYKTAVALPQPPMGAEGQGAALQLPAGEVQGEQAPGPEDIPVE